MDSRSGTGRLPKGVCRRGLPEGVFPEGFPEGKGTRGGAWVAREGLQDSAKRMRSESWLKGKRPVKSEEIRAGAAEGIGSRIDGSSPSLPLTRTQTITGDRNEQIWSFKPCLDRTSVLPLSRHCKALRQHANDCQRLDCASIHQSHWSWRWRTAVLRRLDEVEEKRDGCRRKAWVSISRLESQWTHGCRSCHDLGLLNLGFGLLSANLTAFERVRRHELIVGCCCLVAAGLFRRDFFQQNRR